MNTASLLEQYRYAAALRTWKSDVLATSVCLEEVIVFHTLALSVFTHKDAPQQWALLQSSLGDVYRKSSTGERRANLTRARECYHAALSIHTDTAFPIEYAMTQATLGVVCTELGKGDGEDSYEQAITHYQQALEIFTEDAFSIQWATIQQGLCRTYLLRLVGDSSSNIQQAIAHGRTSLRILTAKNEPVIWATAHAALGEAYWQATHITDLQELYSGCSVMQEQALRHSKAALQVLSKQEHPLEWAQVQQFLARLYFERIRGVQRENLAQARQFCHNAAQVFTPTFSLQDWNALQALQCQISSHLHNAHD